MNKQNKSSLFSQILPLILTGKSNQAFQLIIENNLYYEDEFRSFCASLDKIDTFKILEQYPDSITTLNRIQNLCTVSILQTKLSLRQKELLDVINKTNVSRDKCLKFMFFLSHLSTLDFFRGYLLEPSEKFGYFFN